MASQFSVPSPTPAATGTVRCQELVRYFEGLRDDPSLSPDELIQFTLADLVDGALPAMYKESELHRPDAECVQRNIGLDHRAKVVAWLLQAFGVMGFEESILHGSVSLLDQYYSSVPNPVASGDLQKVLMSAICITLKMVAVVDDLQQPLKPILAHLCRRQISAEDIFATELVMLKVLKFNVSAPTWLDFLEAFHVRLEAKFKQILNGVVPLMQNGSPGNPQQPQGAHTTPGVNEEPRARFWFLAEYLVETAFFAPKVLYEFPSAIVAAGALCLALCWEMANNPSAQTSVQALLAVLFEDVRGLRGLCCQTNSQEADSFDEAFGRAVSSLRDIWIEAHDVSSELYSVSAPLREKFGLERRRRVAQAVPPSEAQMPKVQQLLLAVSLKGGTPGGPSTYAQVAQRASAGISSGSQIYEDHSKNNSFGPREEDSEKRTPPPARPLRFSPSPRMAGGNQLSNQAQQRVGTTTGACAASGAAGVCAAGQRPNPLLSGADKENIPPAGLQQQRGIPSAGTATTSLNAMNSITNNAFGAAKILQQAAPSIVRRAVNGPLQAVTGAQPSVTAGTLVRHPSCGAVPIGRRGSAAAPAMATALSNSAPAAEPRVVATRARSREPLMQPRGKSRSASVTGIARR